MSRPGRRSGPALLVVALASAAPVAQTNVARVTGTVKDDGGKPVSGATVTATNPDQAPSTVTATTDPRGRFGILGLRRGNWVFTIAAPGFQTVRAGGEVELRTNPPINVRLMRSVAPLTGPTSTLTGAEIQPPDRCGREHRGRGPVRRGGRRLPRHAHEGALADQRVPADWRPARTGGRPRRRAPRVSRSRARRARQCRRAAGSRLTKR